MGIFEKLKNVYEEKQREKEMLRRYEKTLKVAYAEKIKQAKLNARKKEIKDKYEKLLDKSKQNKLKTLKKVITSKETKNTLRNIINTAARSSDRFSSSWSGTKQKTDLFGSSNKKQKTWD